ncbi:hypothetical protein skT53_25250 [Effusibacillus dendaii]|uniref:Uncharacterized protein n=1 Tax=Effusibacillus dendaii TaxID=2743772 RepID=A0A7I8DG39_9BACL|nr:hypothetical protein skT53_25250 [Effusibacillus dendaii]
MTHLVNRHMRILAEKALKYARNASKHVRYANEFWFIGGGAIVLQPWIEKLDAELGLPICFDVQEYSQFRNAGGTFLLLDHPLKHKGEVAAGPLFRYRIDEIFFTFDAGQWCGSDSCPDCRRAAIAANLLAGGIHCTEYDRRSHVACCPFWLARDTADSKPF